MQRHEQAIENKSSSVDIAAHIAENGAAGVNLSRDDFKAILNEITLLAAVYPGRSAQRVVEEVFAKHGLPPSIPIPAGLGAAARRDYIGLVRDDLGDIGKELVDA